MTTSRRQFDSKHVTAVANNDWFRLGGVVAAFVSALSIALVLFLVSDFFADRDKDIAEIKGVVQQTNETVQTLATDMAVIEAKYLDLKSGHRQQWTTLGDQGERISRLEGASQ